MTPAKQLTLPTRPTLEPFPDRLRDPVYAGFAFTAKDRPADVASDVVERFIKRRGHAPREIQCHASMVEIIGHEVQGIPVLGIGKSLRVFLLGPQEA